MRACRPAAEHLASELVASLHAFSQPTPQESATNACTAGTTSTGGAAGSAASDVGTTGLIHLIHEIGTALDHLRRRYDELTPRVQVMA